MLWLFWTHGSALRCKSEPAASVNDLGEYWPWSCSQLSHWHTRTGCRLWVNLLSQERKRFFSFGYAIWNKTKNWSWKGIFNCDTWLLHQCVQYAEVNKKLKNFHVSLRHGWVIMLNAVWLWLIKPAVTPAVFHLLIFLICLSGLL